MDMEISAGNITGGRASPLSPPALPQPSPNTRLMLPSVTTNGSDIVNNLNKISRDHPLEDRGVDLSFDVKKETETEIKTENCDIIKSEFKHSEHCEGSMLQSPGGRLKIFKDGKLMIDLKADGEKGRWVTSSSTRVYWPPPASLTARVDSTASHHTVTGSEGSIESCSVHSQSSAWQGLPSPRPSPLPSSHSPLSHRVKPVPRKCYNPPKDLVFAMVPPQGIRNYRRKIRPYKRKCRNPSSEIKLNQFIIKIEINAAQGKPPKKRFRPNIDPKLRFARCMAQLERLTKLRDRVHVPIQAWKPGRKDLADLVKGPVSPYLPHAPRAKTESGGMKIKSELKMVTETCTATVTSVTSSPKATNKVKAETRVVTAETRQVPVRSAPITPTVARVKQELPVGLKTASTAIMSPELARVKMEIGPNAHHGFLERMRDERDGAFVSPRKRLMRDMREFDNGSPSAKNRRLSSEHRLSTDSLGSTSDRSSPYRAPHSPHRGAMSPGLAMSPRPGAKVSNFSIDSIMGGGAGPQMPRQPSTPSKVSGRTPSLPLAPTPTRPTPSSRSSPPPGPGAAPYSPYSLYPGLHPLLAGDPRLIDPRLAQLAGLAQLQAQVSPLAAGQDPRLASHPFLLNPAYMAAAAAASSPLSSLLAASQAASQAAVWTPPVATTAITTPSPTPPPVPPPRQFASSPTPPPSQASPSLPPPPVRPLDQLRQQQPGRKAPDIQYRGEPSRCSKLFGDNDDAPLNLSMKPTTL